VGVDRQEPRPPCQEPEATPPGISPFESWEEIERIAEEVDPRFAAIPIFAAGTGLRPEEWIALERLDIDRAARVVTVRRVFSQGRLKECAKTSRQRGASRCATASSTLSTPRRYVWTRGSCFRRPGAAIST
jgi:integrase